MKGPTEVEMSLLPRLTGDKAHFGFNSATTVGTGIAAVELLDVKLGRRECGARSRVTSRTKIGFVGSVAGPFAQAAPEAAKEA